METRGVKSPLLSLTDESRYKNEVLQLGESESEDSLDNRLVAEATELGLKIPEVHIAASLAATIDAGILDIPISEAATTASTHQPGRCSYTQPRAFADFVRTSIASVDDLSGALSQTNLSDRDHSGSIPSIDSFSTRPTSISSCDVRFVAAQHRSNPDTPSRENPPRRIHSFASSASTSGSTTSALKLSERKRSNFINAIGRPFRKRRTPSAISLPAHAHISFKKSEGGGTDTVLLEAQPTGAVGSGRAENQSGETTLHVEVPVFDEAARRRTQEDADLQNLYEKHKDERRRFVALQNELLDRLKAAHQALVEEKKSDCRESEQVKREWNTAFLARMEERQLSVEIDQAKEFERSKRNAQTRIKYMEGYVKSSSPPASPQLSSSDIEQQQQQQMRTLSRRQKEQLAQEHLDWNSMDRLHEARIKVLRERQEQQLHETAKRLEKELEALIKKSEEDIMELERSHRGTEMEMLRVFEAKKLRLRRRWNIEEAVLRKKLEDRSGLLYGPLPIISFTESDDNDGERIGDRNSFERT